MSKEKYKRIKLALSIVLAFIAASYAGNTIFTVYSPQINTTFVAAIPQTIQSTVTSFIAKMYELRPSPAPTTSAQQSDTSMIFLTPKPTNIPSPYIPIPSPTFQPPMYPTIRPTSYPMIRPTLRPTIKPTSLPVNNPPPINCPNSSNNSYASISVVSGHTSNAETQPEINISFRGFSKINTALSPIDVGGDNDGGKAPQFSTVYSPKRLPSFTAAYQLNSWNSNTKGPPLSSPTVSLLGMSAKPGEGIHVPVSQYDIGEGKQVMVLFANASSITIKYTREDDIVSGYTVHIDGMCVDPQLLRLYQSLNSSGRSSLPALAGGQQLGTAQSSEVRIAIRDTGSLMDPRVRKDWWVGY